MSDILNINNMGRHKIAVNNLGLLMLKRLTCLSWLHPCPPPLQWVPLHSAPLRPALSPS